MAYVSTAEANTYLETSGEDTLIWYLISHACHLVDRFCNLQNTDTLFALEAWTITAERHDYNDTWPYYFRYTPVNSITHINWTSGTFTELTHYIARGREITFDTAVNLSAYNTTFWIITFTYTKGFATIPADVKQATLMITASLYATRKLQGVNNYTQGDLSLWITMEGVFGADSKMYNEIRSLLSKYKVVNVLS